MFSSKLRELIGYRPASRVQTKLENPMRFHQSWWRVFVLGEKQGRHPGYRDQSIGNTISGGLETKKNFLSENIITSINETFIERKTYAPGIIKKDRLYDNLLSSQPLCFNFFGEFKQDKHLAKKFLASFYPEISKVNGVYFEYKPKDNCLYDRSAFDVLFEVEKIDKKGFIGFECKYIDDLASKLYDKNEYQIIFNNSDIFVEEYERYISKDFNQLFRNQLIAESVLQNNEYDFAYTGLFCHHDDEDGIETGKNFRAMLDPKANFQIITYKNFIENIQRQITSWKQREWTMLLWARYCSTKLSDNCKQLII